jgi:photosystem II stability/assembly factor-like uncharacterized protein
LTRRWRIVGRLTSMGLVLLVAAFAGAVPSGDARQPTTLHLVGPSRVGARAAPTSARSATRTTDDVALVGVEVTQLVPVGSTSAWAMANLGGRQAAPSVLRTTKGGATWSDVTPPAIPSSEAALFALSASQAWLTVNLPRSALTQSARLLVTSDGGGHWTTAGTLPVPCQVEFVNRSDGWCPGIEPAAGSEAVDLYRTTDAGHHWTLVTSSASATDLAPTSSGILPFACDKSFSFQTPTLGWVSLSCGGGAVAAYRSTDAGAEWSPVAFSPQPPASGEATTIGSPDLVQHQGALAADIAGATVFYRTANGGLSWQPVRPPARARTWTPDVIDPLHWVLAGDRQIATTADGGQTWAFAGSDAPLRGGARVPSPYTITFTSPRTGWAIAQDPSTILYTVTAGRHWTRVRIPG